MKTKCPYCLALFDAPDKFLQKTVKCKNCSYPFVVIEYKGEIDPLENEININSNDEIPYQEEARLEAKEVTSDYVINATFPTQKIPEYGAIDIVSAIMYILAYLFVFLGVLGGFVFISQLNSSGNSSGYGFCMMASMFFSAFTMWVFGLLCRMFKDLVINSWCIRQMSVKES